jgi:hypothetical protein
MSNKSQGWVAMPLLLSYRISCTTREHCINPLHDLRRHVHSVVDECLQRWRRARIQLFRCRATRDGGCNQLNAFASLFHGGPNDTTFLIFFAMPRYLCADYLTPCGGRQAACLALRECSARIGHSEERPRSRVWRGGMRATAHWRLLSPMSPLGAPSGMPGFHFRGASRRSSPQNGTASNTIGQRGIGSCVVRLRLAESFCACSSTFRGPHTKTAPRVASRGAVVLGVMAESQRFILNEHSLRSVPRICMPYDTDSESPLSL